MARAELADPPIFINCRDRVEHLRGLVSWLEDAGHARIVLLDNDSRYEPLLDYFDASPHEVVRLGRNLGSKALWLAGLAPTVPFVYTDPDVVPIEDCPLDAVAYLWEQLGKHPSHTRAGLGLYLDDVPPEQCSQSWERSLVSSEREVSPGIFDSLIDTTFALYEPGVPFTLSALRCGAPYQARHMSWYAEQTPSEEDRFYLARANEELPPHALPGTPGSAWKGVLRCTPQ